MAVFNKFNSFVEAIAEKAHNLGADTFFMQLLNTTPAAANAIETDLPADLTTGGGYTAGGLSIGTAAASLQSGGLYKLTIADYTFTASGAVGPFRYVAIFNNTATSKELIGWFDYGSAISLNTGETLLLDFDGTNGVLTIQ